MFSIRYLNYFSVSLLRPRTKVMYMLESYSWHWKGENKGFTSIDLHNCIKWSRLWDFIFLFEIIPPLPILYSQTFFKKKQKCTCAFFLFSTILSDLLGNELGRAWKRKMLIWLEFGKFRGFYFLLLHTNHKSLGYDVSGLSVTCNLRRLS